MRRILSAVSFLFCSILILGCSPHEEKDSSGAASLIGLYECIDAFVQDGGGSDLEQRLTSMFSMRSFDVVAQWGREVKLSGCDGVEITLEEQREDERFLLVASSRDQGFAFTLNLHFRFDENQDLEKVWVWSSSDQEPDGSKMGQNGQDKD